jgi:hypothetical protein
MVLVPLDGALDAVQAGRLPPGIIAGVVPPAGQGEAVGLEVALVDDQQPVLVAQIQVSGDQADSGWSAPR